MTGSIELTTKEQVERFLDKYDDFLFDCDGVIWQGGELLPHVAETLAMLRARGKRLVFVTNNSRKSRRQYVAKFASLGMVVDRDEVFGSSYSAAVYLREVVQFPADKKVLIVGESGMEEELTEAGIAWVGGTTNSGVPSTDEHLNKLAYDPSVGCVLCGLDTSISYYKIANALIHLQHKQTLFLATNLDATLPTNGQLLPGAGTIVSTLAYSSGRTPLALGKPAPAMLRCIQAKFQFDPARACMVGDRLDTDVAFGLQGGLGTLLVLSGVSGREELAANTADGSAPVQPAYYAARLGSLYELLRGSQ